MLTILASNAGTSRILTLLLRYNSSQNAHSKFIGAFIYGVVATIGIKSEKIVYSLFL